MLQYTVYVRRGEQVAAAGNQAYLLKGIIDDDGQMISCGQILPGEHDIAEEHRIDVHESGLIMRSLTALFESQSWAQTRRLHRVQPHGVTLARYNPLLALLARQRAADSRVSAFNCDSVWRFSGSRDFLSDLAPGAEAWIDEAAPLEFVECSSVGIAARGLAQHRFAPAQTEPAQVIVDRGYELLAGSSQIQVLNAQQKFTRGGSGMRGNCGERMSQMQEARGAGREARSDPAKLGAHDTRCRSDAA